MAKTKSKFLCQQCGFTSLRWLGKCPECGTWDSLVEEIERSSLKKTEVGLPQTKPLPLPEVQSLDVERLDLGIGELNRVLGGGLVKGTVVLLAGDPGIGKSTLLLQAAVYAARCLPKVLYITGEESAQQIKMRATRLGTGGAPVWVWAETDLDCMTKEIMASQPSLVIVDSIQTVSSGGLDSAPGSVGQIRQATAQILALAKGLQIPFFIVGHITKEGSIAGPRVLEHMVDTVLYFEGERHYQYRLLRAIKNRFGSTFELGVFEMVNEGLAEVLNPSKSFLAERPHLSPGSVVSACLEGTRPLLVEIQALVSQSAFGQPRRMATGADYNRVNMLLTVLEKRVGLNFGYQDAYVNIVGGIRVQEPALDLGIALALASSFKNRPCMEGLAVMGEVGLTGEIRGVSHAGKRLQEAKKLGFTHCLTPVGFEGKEIEGIQLLPVRTLAQALEVALV